MAFGRLKGFGDGRGGLRKQDKADRAKQKEGFEWQGLHNESMRF